jgi:sirohydrochlorin ferrochelatase
MGVAAGEDWFWQSLARERLGLAGTVQAVWLEPLLACAGLISPDQHLAWAQVLGCFQDPLVADQLRRLGVESGWQEASLLPLLGHQRQAQDGALLLDLALRPAPLALRQAALEGLAVGLAAWPVGPLRAGLVVLAQDLHGALAAKAVDLLARLPQGQPALRRLGRLALDTEVAQRIHRRLSPSPLVLVVHGRRGGVIPDEVRALASAVEQRRGAPVVLQALTAEPPQTSAGFLNAAQRAQMVTLVPLLLVPGGHVRVDLNAIARDWRRRLASQQGVSMQRRSFLGAWPAWQQVLAAQLRQVADGKPCCWLHHPLDGELAKRYVALLSQVLGCPGVSAPYSAAMDQLGPVAANSTVVQPLTLAANRLTESLEASLMGEPENGCDRQVQLLPPLLQQLEVREFLLASLGALP